MVYKHVAVQLKKWTRPVSYVRGCCYVYFSVLGNQQCNQLCVINKVLGKRRKRRNYVSFNPLFSVEKVYDGCQRRSGDDDV